MVEKLNDLSPLALRVVALRVGADGAGPRDRAAVAEQLGCHPRFVERIEAHAIATIGERGWSILQREHDTAAAASARLTLDLLLDPARAARLVDQANADPDQLTLDAVLQGVVDLLWRERPGASEDERTLLALDPLR